MPARRVEIAPAQRRAREAQQRPRLADPVPRGAGERPRGLELPLRRPELAQPAAGLPDVGARAALELRVSERDLLPQGALAVGQRLPRLSSDQVDEADVPERVGVPTRVAQLLGEGQRSLVRLERAGVVARGQGGVPEGQDDVGRVVREPRLVEEAQGGAPALGRRANLTHVLVDRRLPGQARAPPDRVAHGLEEPQRFVEPVERLLVLPAPLVQPRPGDERHRLPAPVSERGPERGGFLVAGEGGVEVPEVGEDVPLVEKRVGLPARVPERPPERLRAPVELQGARQVAAVVPDLAEAVEPPGLLAAAAGLLGAGEASLALPPSLLEILLPVGGERLGEAGLDAHPALEEPVAGLLREGQRGLVGPQRVVQRAELLPRLARALGRARGRGRIALPRPRRLRLPVQRDGLPARLALVPQAQHLRAREDSLRLGTGAAARREEDRDQGDGRRGPSPRPTTRRRRSGAGAPQPSSPGPVSSSGGQ